MSSADSIAHEFVDGHLAEGYRCFRLKLQATVMPSLVADPLSAGKRLLDLAGVKGWPALIHSSMDSTDPWRQRRDIVAAAIRRAAGSNIRDFLGI